MSKTVTNVSTSDKKRYIEILKKKLSDTEYSIEYLQNTIKQFKELDYQDILEGIANRTINATRFLLEATKNISENENTRVIHVPFSEILRDLEYERINTERTNRACDLIYETERMLKNIDLELNLKEPEKKH